MEIPAVEIEPVEWRSRPETNGRRLAVISRWAPGDSLALCALLLEQCSTGQVSHSELVGIGVVNLVWGNCLAKGGFGTATQTARLGTPAGLVPIFTGAWSVTRELSSQQHFTAVDYRLYAQRVYSGCEAGRPLAHCLLR